MSGKMTQKKNANFTPKSSATDIKKEFGLTKKVFNQYYNTIGEKISKEKITNKIIKNYIKAEDKLFAQLLKESEKQFDVAEKKAIKIKKAKVVQQKKEAKKVVVKQNIIYTSRILYYSNVISWESALAELGLLKKDVKSFFTDTKGDLYIQLYTQLLNVKSAGINDFEHKRTFNYNKKDWTKLWSILRTDQNAPKSEGVAGSMAIDCIIVSKVNTPHYNEVDKIFKPKERKWFASDVEGGMYHNYINYSLDKSAKTFNEMFEIKTCDYVQENYKSNSCFVNILVDTFYNAFQNKNKLYNFDATYEDFCDLLDLDIKQDSIGLTINKSLKFFKQFKISLCVIGMFGIIEMYKPEKRNQNLSPSALYILVSNGHCYKLNENMNSFNKKIWESDALITDEMKKVDVKNVRNTYFIQKTDDFDYNVIYVNSLSEILTDIKTTIDEEGTVKHYIVYNGNLNNLMMDMIHGKPSYIPDVTFENGKIMQLKFKISNVIGTISVCSTIDPEQKDLSIGECIYKPYHTARNELYKELFTEDHLSTYNPANIELEKIYTMKPMTGYFDNDTICNELYTGVDTRKAYTGDFMDIEMFPVYGYFDIWKPYDNHKIEDYNQYLVLSKSSKPEHLILFPESVSRVTGYKLNRIEFKDYTILHYKRPSKLVQSNSKELINKLWATKISQDSREDIQSKKDIFNIISGLLEKKQNKKSLTKIFKNYDEAFYYQTAFGGELYTMGYDEVGDLANSKVFGGSGGKQQSYLIEKRCKVELVNGFTPIKEMIYDIRSLKNYQTFMKLKAQGIRCVGIKTDSILIEWNRHIEKIVKSKFDLSDKIGCYKLEYRKELPGDVIRKVLNKLPVVQEVEVVTHHITNERDVKEINCVFEKYSNMLLLGNLPGVGKTTTACNFVCKQNYLFVHIINYVKH